MKEISKFAIPKEGTPEWSSFKNQFDNNKDKPAVKSYLNEVLNKALASSQVQELNGAGLPADTLLREYNKEYNFRVFEHSLHQLPGSFNVVEAFNKFIPPSAIFNIRKEIDCLFSFEDFLDFATSDKCPDLKSELNEYFEDGVIYSFNSIDDPSNSFFSSLDGEEFGVLSISLVKHKSEISVVMLAGQKCDLVEKTNHLIEINSQKGRSLNGIEPDESLNIEAVPLLPNSDLWRTIVLTRFDIDSCTTDVRYVYQDAGRSFVGQTDDIDCFVDNSGNFFSKEDESFYHSNKLNIDSYGPLFELCKLSIYLPVFRYEYEDTVHIERHPTEFSKKRNKVSFKKIVNYANSDIKLTIRNVENIKPINRKLPSNREFTAPEFKIETSGYWKKLDFPSVGEDKNGSPIQGRTWVNKTLEWMEKSSDSSSLNVVKKSLNNVNDGYIYVMRNASHPIDFFKIGLTKRTPEERAKELSSNTSSIDKFLIVGRWGAKDCELAEKIIHEKLKKYRINEKREFFKIDYEKMVAVINDVVNAL